VTASTISLNWLPSWLQRRAAPEPPQPEPVVSADPTLAALRIELAAFKAQHDQQISSLGVQIEHERQERQLAVGYAQMLQGSLETVTREASTFASELHSMREVNKQTDERLKWQNTTIETMKLQIKQLEDTVDQMTQERAALVHERQVLEARNTWLTRENAMLRAAAAPEALAAIDDRMNTDAMRRVE
jgi:chromosome segregation ATPase